MVLQEEIDKVQNRAARYVTRSYCFETGSMTGILEPVARKNNNRSTEEQLAEGVNIIRKYKQPSLMFLP